MNLPPRSYFHLVELAETWGLTINHISTLVMDRQIEVCVMANGSRIEENDPPYKPGHMFDGPEDDILFGPQPVLPQDIWPVLQQGAATIRRFRRDDAKGYADLIGPFSYIRVRLDDLLVVRQERLRFESQCGIEALRLDPAGDQSVFQHSASYNSVQLGDLSFRLGAIQAGVIRQLHEASKTSNPWRYGPELMKDAKSDRVVDVFKSQANWKELIESDEHGYYRLKLPNAIANRKAAYRRVYFRTGALRRSAA